MGFVRALVRRMLQAVRVLTRVELGLDRPLVVQYARWAAAAVRGDLGRSFRTGRPVGHDLGRRLPVTISVAVPALLLTWFFLS